jgi:uncharacterized protein YhhL (DUF1145 family)
MGVAKWLVLFAWFFGASSFFVSTGTPAAHVGRVVFLALVLVHAIECVAFLPRLRAAGGSLGGHLLQTFLFGIFHLRSLGERA